MFRGDAVEHPSKILKRHDLHPKKSLGQNFLVPEPWPSRIADAVGAAPGDCVVEIGPGLGALTAALAPRCRRLVAIEIDERMRSVLETELADVANLEIVAGDALRFDLSTLNEDELVLAGNLPYYISSPLLRWAATGAPRVTSATFTLQKEVADRVCAEPGGKQYGALTVLIQRAADASLAMRLPPGAFHPQPDVDSAVIRLEMRAQPRADVPAVVFEKVVFAAFGQRRKTLRNSLKGSGIAALEVIDLALDQAGIDGGRRAETLTVEEFGALAAALPAT